MFISGHRPLENFRGTQAAYQLKYMLNSRLTTGPNRSCNKIRKSWRGDGEFPRALDTISRGLSVEVCRIGTRVQFVAFTHVCPRESRLTTSSRAIRTSTRELQGMSTGLSMKSMLRPAAYCGVLQPMTHPASLAFTKESSFHLITVREDWFRWLELRSLPAKRRSTSPTGRKPLCEHRTFFVSRKVDVLPAIAEVLRGKKRRSG